MTAVIIIMMGAMAVYQQRKQIQARQRTRTENIKKLTESILKNGNRIVMKEQIKREMCAGCKTMTNT